MNMEDFKNSTFNRDELIKEAIRAICFSDLSQGEDIQDEKRENKKKELRTKLEKASEEKVTLPEELHAKLLTAEDLENSEISSQILEQYNFYEVKFAVGLIARNNWAFTRLECHLRFYTQEQDSQCTPIIHSIYPYTERRDSINVGTPLNSTLDSRMVYRTLQNYHGLTQNSATEEKKSIGTGITITGKLFEYRSYRYDVKAEIANEQCKWILNGNQYVEDESQKLRVILRLPKTCTEIFAECLAIAKHKPGIGEIFKKDWIEFTNKVSAFLKGGLEVRNDNGKQPLPVILNHGSDNCLKHAH